METILTPKYRYYGEDYLSTMLMNTNQTFHHTQHRLALGHKKIFDYFDKRSKLVPLKVGDPLISEIPNVLQLINWHLNGTPIILHFVSALSCVISNQINGGTHKLHMENLRLRDESSVWILAQSRT